jgi:putative membrane protein
MFDTWHWGWGWMGMGLMWGLPVLLIVLLVVFLLNARRDGGGQRETPREILDRRFASGEVSKEQYEEMKRTLS